MTSASAACVTTGSLLDRYTAPYEDSVLVVRPGCVPVPERRDPESRIAVLARNSPMRSLLVRKKHGKDYLREQEAKTELARSVGTSVRR